MITDTDLPLMYCVLDGLDECDEAGLRFLIPKLMQEFSKEARTCGRKSFRLATVSRPSGIMGGMYGCEQISLDDDNSELVKGDLEQFIHARVKEIEGVEGFGDELREYVKTTLLQRAEGTFLWAGFALTELSQHTTCTQLMNTLEIIPPGLAAVYSQILLRIPEEHRENSFKILQWVVLAQFPLSLAELATAIGLVSSFPGMHQEQSIRDAITLCGPILRLEGTTVNLVHASARDYLLRDVADMNSILEQARIK
jgi:hypothetical protein